MPSLIDNRRQNTLRHRQQINESRFLQHLLRHHALRDDLPVEQADDAVAKLGAVLGVVTMMMVALRC